MSWLSFAGQTFKQNNQFRLSYTQVLAISKFILIHFRDLAAKFHLFSLFFLDVNV